MTYFRCFKSIKNFRRIVMIAQVVTPKKKRIVICSSMTFIDQYTELSHKIRDLGYAVTIPELAIEEIEADVGTFTELANKRGGSHILQPDDPIWMIKQRAMQEYLEEVSEADAILVTNYPKHGEVNYIGANAFMEMTVAFFLHIPINVLYGPPTCSKREEVLGMSPIFCEGDITKIVVSGRY
jgi:hypothetical protein